MNYKYLILFLLILSNCKIQSNIDQDLIFNQKMNNFSNNGFALVFNETLYNEKLINKKINDSDLIIFQKNLKTGTTVKVKNILNNKYIIAKIGKNANYPNFYNSVISYRIAKEIDLDIKQPYVQIYEIPASSVFFSKKAKTYEEERVVANKAPVDVISVNDLNKKKTISKKKVITFRYIIKIADFYFNDTAQNMINRIKKETSVKDVKLMTLSNTQYRVFLGPFFSINSLQKAFNDISILEFENIEIIKNDKN